MRKKEIASTVKWSEKNSIYLQRLGMIDARTGKVLKNANMSGFINECVTMVCESGMSDRVNRSMANSDDLLRSWCKYSVAVRSKQIAKLQAEIVDIANKSPVRKKFALAMESIMEL